MERKEYELGKLILRFSGLMLSDAIKNSSKYTKPLNIEDVIKELNKEIQELNKTHKQHNKTLTEKLVSIANYCAILYAKLEQKQKETTPTESK